MTKERIEAQDVVFAHVHIRNGVVEALEAFADATGTKLPVAVRARMEKAQEASERFQEAKQLHQSAVDRRTQLERSMGEEEIQAALDCEPQDWKAPVVPDLAATQRRAQVYERAVTTRLADLVAEVDYDQTYAQMEKAWDKLVEFDRPPTMTLAELAEKEAQVSEARQTILHLNRVLAYAKFTGPNHIVKDFRNVDELVHAGDFWFDVLERPAQERAEALKVQRQKDAAARDRKSHSAAETAKFRARSHEAQAVIAE